MSKTSHSDITYDSQRSHGHELISKKISATTALPQKGPTPRITDGSPATPGQFPYQVSLEWSIFPLLIPYSHVCGGSILNEKWVLTAGHCITELPKLGKIRVNAGKHGILDAGKDQQIVKVAEKIVHENYAGGVAPFDIALLKLAKPLIFNERVGPVSLPKQDDEFEGSVFLSGWGSTSKNLLPILPLVLHFAEIPLVNYETCNEALLGIDSSAELYETQVCTGPIGDSKSACSGDSGGPLVKMVNGTPVQVGIVSWGLFPCGQGGPSVYTRVPSYIEWIKNKI